MLARIEEMAQDARFAARLLLKERWFSAAAILALALGMGVTSMVATIVNGYNLRGLPVEDPERVLYVGTRDPSGRDRGLSLRLCRAAGAEHSPGEECDADGGERPAV